MMKCRFACLSTRNSILPPLISVTALATSIVTVPVLGFGMSPRGPRILPRRPTFSAAARYALLRCVICSSPTGCSCGQWASAWPCHGPGPGRSGTVRSCSVLNGDAHRTSGARDDLHRSLDVVGVEVLELGRRDLAHL